MIFFGDFQGAIAVLSAKTKLLDPNQLDQVEGRLHALGIRLSQITDKKEAIENADKQNKVMYIFHVEWYVRNVSP